MPSDDQVKMNGVVEKVLGYGFFSVRTEEGAVVRCQLKGNLRRNKIKVLEGDRVRIEASPYDLTNGMISYRFK